MLLLQRASAGSGKTYALAKQFIMFLISSKSADGSLHPAGVKEIRHNLGSVIAITFTNKATAEMKERIVNKLAALARLADEDLPEKEKKRIDYLAEFKEIFKTSDALIGKAAKIALNELLNNYSEFRVSTIDSFFQEILRTFAYESNLNENYQVEIDDEIITVSAIDNTLTDFDRRSQKNTPAKYWIKHLMEDYSSSRGGWNPFNRVAGNKSLYSEVVNAFRRLETEEFKQKRYILENYFSTPDADLKFIEATKKLSRLADEEREKAFKKVKEARDNLKSLIETLTVTDIKKVCNSFVLNHLNKIDSYSFDMKTGDSSLFKSFDIRGKKTIFKSGQHPEGADKVNEAALTFYDAYEAWKNMTGCHYSIYKAVYEPLFPYLGMMEEIRFKMSDYLEKNNLIKLGDTNTILKKIIGEDDTPFIYERLGARLNHYLIDEFQDTSRMQWDILFPLLQESDSRGEDNLIIGDAKQSIYRFRNADPSLITTTVPEQFFDTKILGLEKNENVNWRSEKKIVEFNNYFFTALSEELNDKAPGNHINFNDLYSTVNQKPHKQAGGYVEIRFENEATPPDVPVLIEELLNRGYSQKDIAILVDTNANGKKIINELINYNSNLQEGALKIDFLSEESLTIGSSEAVGIIVGIIDKMAKGTLWEPLSEEDLAKREKPIKWNEIKDNFRIFSLQHSELPVELRVEEFLKDPATDNAISQMLQDMQATVLPAVVEAAVTHFVPEDLRETQAPFIAAFQDLVLEYCERYPADPASFIEWWNSKGIKHSISFPEGIDAVRIMTVHKSKGLEFNCVILPFGDTSIMPEETKAEWRWVNTPQSLLEIGLPPLLPVETKSILLMTEHSDIYSLYASQVIMDNLNSAYVAFTRAVRELYIFAEKPRENNLGGFLVELCGNKDLKIPEKENMPSFSDFLFDEEANKMTIGEKTDPETIKILKEKENENKEDSGNTVEIRGYSSPGLLPFLHFAEPDLTPLIELDEEDKDPRSEGNLLHMVMQKIKNVSDLKKALLSLRMKGLITGDIMKEWDKLLTEAFNNPTVKEWFKEGLTVLNEQSFWNRQTGVCRPDRIVIDPETRLAKVIDFKFGNSENHAKYFPQVRKYMKVICRNIDVTGISGYLWYPLEKKFFEVKS